MISVSPWLTNSSIMSSAKGSITSMVAAKYTAVIFMADHIPSFMRSTFCAPMFCPQ